MTLENETYSTEGPVCPYCGHMQNVSDDPSIYYDEDLTEVECHECERTYSCSVYVRHSWTSTPMSSESPEVQMCVDLANCGGDCPECQLEGGRTKIDEGEIRYEFEVHSRQPTIVATFRGPRMGTAFEMSYDDARQMRDDLETAMAAFKGRWSRRD